MATRDVESFHSSSSSFLARGAQASLQRRCGFDRVALLVAVSLSSLHLCGGFCESGLGPTQGISVSLAIRSSSSLDGRSSGGIVPNLSHYPIWAVG